MTKAQAKAMNQKFIELSNQKEELRTRAEMLDTLLVMQESIAQENILGFGIALDSLKLVKEQFKISQHALFIQTEEVEKLKVALKKKPVYYPLTSMDVVMTTLFSVFGTLMIFSM